MAALVSRDAWQGRRVLVTGHTGFKGAWLCHWLQALGADVTGIALPQPDPRALHRVAAPTVRSIEQDITDLDGLRKAVASAAPEVVLHLAAQPIVRLSHLEPATTFGTNVMGTVHVLEAAREVASLEALVVVTSDKVYENDGSGRPFSEDESLGGKDPYSASKACAELVTAAYRGLVDWPVPTSTARAGNVIGGGDRAAYRLVPDLVRAAEQGEAVVLRYPDATRPWQHVLDAACGYLTLAEALLQRGDGAPAACNFGPDTAAESQVTVLQVAEGVAERLGGVTIEIEPSHVPEAPALGLDPTLARGELGWESALTTDEAISWTADWYAHQVHGGDPMEMTSHQLDAFRERVEAG